MRTATLATLASVFLLAHRAIAFDIYLNEESDCPEEEIDIVCEEQEVGDCCNGKQDTLYSSAQASDDQGGVVLYALGQGQPSDAANRCSIQLEQDDTCATTDVPAGSAAGARGDGDDEDEDPSEDEEPTDGSEDGEDDGGGDQDRRRRRGGSARRHARALAPEEEKEHQQQQQQQQQQQDRETYIEKNKRAKRVDGWRQTQYTAYALRDATHVYKLSRDSEHAPAYEALTDRQERVDFLRRHGVAKRR